MGWLARGGTTVTTNDLLKIRGICCPVVIGRGWKTPAQRRLIDGEVKTWAKEQAGMTGAEAGADRFRDFLDSI